MYHFKEPHIKITQEWLQSKVEIVDYFTQIKGWWVKGNFQSKPLPIELPTAKFQKKYSNYGHTFSKNFWKKRCFIIYRKMGLDHSPNHVKWISIELGEDHLIELG